MKKGAFKAPDPKQGTTGKEKPGESVPDTKVKISSTMKSGWGQGVVVEWSNWLMGDQKLELFPVGLLLNRLELNDEDTPNGSSGVIVPESRKAVNLVSYSPSPPSSPTHSLVSNPSSLAAVDIKREPESPAAADAQQVAIDRELEPENPAAADAQKVPNPKRKRKRGFSLPKRRKNTTTKEGEKKNDDIQIKKIPAQPKKVLKKKPPSTTVPARTLRSRAHPIDAKACSTATATAPMDSDSSNVCESSSALVPPEISENSPGMENSTSCFKTTRDLIQILEEGLTPPTTPAPALIQTETESRATTPPPPPPPPPPPAVPVAIPKGHNLSEVLERMGIFRTPPKSAKQL